MEDSPCDCPDFTDCAIGDCANGTVSVYRCYPGVWKALGQRACCAFGGYCSNPGEVCLSFFGGYETLYSCVPDPCAPSPLACWCAEDVCYGAYDCSIHGGSTISCVIPDP